MVLVTVANDRSFEKQGTSGQGESMTGEIRTVGMEAVTGAAIEPVIVASTWPAAKVVH